jgi:hypothetical protein
VLADLHPRLIARLGLHRRRDLAGSITAWKSLNLEQRVDHRIDPNGVRIIAEATQAAA